MPLPLTLDFAHPADECRMPLSSRFIVPAKRGASRDRKKIGVSMHYDPG